MHFVCLWLDKAQAICGKPRILSGLPLGIKISVPGLHTMRHFRGGVGGDPVMLLFIRVFILA